MNIFLDTNVLVDVIADRKPFYDESAKVWTLAETGQVTGFVSTLSFANISYLASRALGKSDARKALLSIRDAFDVVPFDEKILHQAMDADSVDFEDAIQLFSALRANATTIITRNAKHFPADSIAIQTPDEFLASHFPE